MIFHILMVVLFKFSLAQSGGSLTVKIDEVYPINTKTELTHGLEFSHVTEFLEVERVTFKAKSLGPKQRVVLYSGIDGAQRFDISSELKEYSYPTFGRFKHLDIFPRFSPIYVESVTAHFKASYTQKHYQAVTLEKHFEFSPEVSSIDLIKLVEEHLPNIKLRGKHLSALRITLDSTWGMSYASLRFNGNIFWGPERIWKYPKKFSFLPEHFDEDLESLELLTEKEMEIEKLVLRIEM